MLVRHGATAHTADKRFSGGLASSNPALTDEGRAQVREVADWLAPLGEAVEAVVTSPVRRTRESAEILAERLGLDLVEEPGFAEMEFGVWDGLTFAEVRDRYPDEVQGWLGSLDVAPPGGESFREVEARVLAGLERVLERYAGKTVLVVSHVTPIKTLVAHAVDAPLSALFRMELSTASVSVVSFVGAAGDDGERPARLDAPLQRPAARGRADARPAALVAAQSSPTTTSRPGPGRRRSRPSTRGRSAARRRRAACAASRPSSSSARTSRPLVALLKWLTTWRRPSTSCSTRTVTTRAREVGRRPPERGVRRGAEVDDQPAAGRLPDDGVQRAAPVSGDPAESGQADATAEPVRRDPLAGADQAVQRRDDGEPGQRAAVCRGVQGAEAECVVQDAGVDPLRRRGGQRA